ncbi:MAG: HAMP domain-containing histidine kinase [Lachnospiraceae bacterium]|nr:HAMP domain-containing histidine kinase [Lachnospiraceae bacterium]
MEKNVSELFKSLDEEFPLSSREIEPKEILGEHSDKNKFYSYYLSRMSHEIRLLLNHIVTAQMFMRMRPDDRERVLECLDITDRQCRYIRNILHQSVYINHLETGKIVWEDAPIVLREIIELALEQIFKDSGERKRNIHIKMENVTHDTVYYDFRRLYRIFEQLLDNSVKFTQDGGEIIITIREVSCQNRVAAYEFVISDDGMGIEAEFMEQLFTPFYRAERVAHARIPGAGLGMTIVHIILEILGGDITVESEPDKGTVYTVKLNIPVYEPDERGNET